MPDRDERRWTLHGDGQPVAAAAGPALADGDTVDVVPASELERLREEVRRYVFNHDVDIAERPELMEILDAPPPADSRWVTDPLYADTLAPVRDRWR